MSGEQFTLFGDDGGTAAAPHAAADPITFTRTRQRRAADPSVSAWVSANAGSGKTYVLTERVMRLMLAGNDPGRILCLTYTKAAAAEMAKRVFGRLGAWTTMPDTQLAEAIADLEGVSARGISGQRLSLARRLFARALETPGGLKIQTIHAFCERVLQQFPLEAGVPGRFEMLDETDQKVLLAVARDAVFAAAAAGGQDRLARALRTLAGLIADGALAGAIEQAIGCHREIAAFVDAAGGIEGARARLGAACGVDADIEPAAIEAEILASPNLPRFEWDAIAAAIRSGSAAKTDVSFADRLAEAAAAGEGAVLERYLEVFLRGNGEMRSAQKLITSGLRTALPALAERIEAEHGRIARLLERRAAATTMEATCALITLTAAVAARYEAIKAQRGALDFDDLIDRTAALLTRADAAAWVQYKLDAGIDHVLVDEAQDTSPRQWQVIAALTAEFFAGQGARPRERTVFAVGDEKQSIYSFQGAQPAWFKAMRTMFERRARAAGKRFESVPLSLSFRSTPDILGAVDRVFADSEIHRNVSLEGPPEPHAAHRLRDPGRVEIWPLMATQKATEPDDWAEPVDTTGAGDGRVRLAQEIARTIRRWLDSGERIEATGRPVRPGDILVLVRQRDAFVSELDRALKRERVPVAGVDRLVVTEHLAIEDLLALVDALTLPEDDYALACALKSPLFGLDDDDLMALTEVRGRSLADALDEEREGRRAEAADRLERYRRLAETCRPFEFFARILSGADAPGAPSGRARFAARFGAEADDVLDALLGLALDYERAQPPTLAGFAAWVRAHPRTIKREMDEGNGAGGGHVRVMTVHGAKGLEAPIVFLADTTTLPRPSRTGSVRLDRAASVPDPSERAELTPAPPRLVLWTPGKAQTTELEKRLAEAAREAADDEYRRLLYVGMTRAADRLIVCGACPEKGEEAVNPKTWYPIIRRALEPEAARVPCPYDADRPILVWRADDQRIAKQAAEREPERAPVAPPPWLRSVLPPAPPPAAPIAPSRLAAAAGKPGPEGVGARADAARRGLLVHALLERLPGTDPAERDALAARLLATEAAELSEAERAGIAAEARAVLELPEAAALFGPGSRAEVPLAGRIDMGGRAVPVFGRIDRLLVSESGVLIVDFKTNRPAPQEAPQGYVVQLALYRRLLGRLYPGRPVEAAILWTAVPRLDRLDPALLDERLDAALARPAPGAGLPAGRPA